MCYFSVEAALDAAPRNPTQRQRVPVRPQRSIFKHFLTIPKTENQSQSPGAVIVQCDRALEWKVRGDQRYAPLKMPKRKLDAFFIPARDSTPKPQHIALSPCLAHTGACHITMSNQADQENSSRRHSRSLNPMPVQRLRHKPVGLHLFNILRQRKRRLGTPPLGQTHGLLDHHEALGQQA